MTIESAGKKYWKAHYEQARMLEAEGIDLDVDGYPLASEGWIHKTLSAESYAEWVHREFIKDRLMRDIMKELS